MAPPATPRPATGVHPDPGDDLRREMARLKSMNDKLHAKFENDKRERDRDRNQNRGNGGNGGNGNHNNRGNGGGNGGNGGNGGFRGANGGGNKNNNNNRNNGADRKANLGDNKRRFQDQRR